MRRLGWMLMIALAPALGAQEQSDSGALPNADAAQAEQLRREIRQRWNEHVRSTLGLSDDQTGQVQATEQRFEQQRQPVRARQRQINQTLNAELSAGTPNEDRVKQLMTARQENQLKLQQINRDEDREMQRYLTPVQHARYQEARRRFQDKVAELIRHRQPQRRQQGMGPRRGRRRRPWLIALRRRPVAVAWPRRAPWRSVCRRASPRGSRIPANASRTSRLRTPRRTPDSAC